MWLGIGFGVALALGLAVALLVARRGEAVEEPLPWSVGDMARMQASIMGTLGAVSITGIVILLGFLTRGGTDAQAVDLNTVTVMFAIAFGYLFNTAYLLTYLPDRTAVGERLYRFYYALCSTLQFRTVNLLVLALTTFTGYYGLTLTVDILAFFVPLGVAGVFLVIAGVSDALGLVRFGECHVQAAAGVALALGFWAAMRFLAVDAAYAQLWMALVFAGVNGLSYVVAGLVPLAPRRPRLAAFLERHARKLAAIDMQVTIVSLALLWMAVAGLV